MSTTNAVVRTFVLDRVGMRSTTALQRTGANDLTRSEHQDPNNLGVDPVPQRLGPERHEHATWEPLSLGVGEPRLTVDFANLAGGDACRVAVTASNGLRASRVVSGPFQVPEKPCAAVILRPIDGEEISPNVVLIGNGWWLEEGRPELETLAWTSDVQGELGLGRVVTAQLEPGTHHISLHAGREDRAGEDSVTVHVT